MRDSGNVAQNGSSIRYPFPKTSTSPSRWGLVTPVWFAKHLGPRVHDEHHMIVILALHSLVSAAARLKQIPYINMERECLWDFEAIPGSCLISM